MSKPCEIKRLATKYYYILEDLCPIIHKYKIGIIVVLENLIKEVMSCLQEK